MRRKINAGRIAVAFVLVAVVALAVFLILNQWVFVVRNVFVSGNGDIPPEDIIRLSRITMGGRLGKLDEEQLAYNVEGDGRLAFEGVEIDYPNTVIMNVRLRTHDAITLQGSKIVVMDSDGYVISVHDRVPAESAPYVTNLKISAYSIGRQIDANPERIAGMKAVVEAIKAVNAKNYVSEIDMEDPNHMTIISRTGIIVSLGDASNMENKIAWMIGALQDLESRGQTSGMLDVASGTKADYFAG